LSESNMQSVASQIEDLYLKYSRNDMNQTLSSLILDSCVTPVITPERLAMEHMMLIAMLHIRVGSEI
ncbi:nucleolar MIF4G domain-containing protein 1-like, partial [Saccoglossus kowalevskii]